MEAMRKIYQNSNSGTIATNCTSLNQSRQGRVQEQARKFKTEEKKCDYKAKINAYK
jgi:hypothetical protein